LNVLRRLSAVEWVFQFLLATVMHEAGKLELLNQVLSKRKATCVSRTVAI
jgi:hypothetical protein